MASKRTVVAVTRVGPPEEQHGRTRVKVRERVRVEETKSWRGGPRLMLWLAGGALIVVAVAATSSQLMRAAIDLHDAKASLLAAREAVSTVRTAQAQQALQRATRQFAAADAASRRFPTAALAPMPLLGSAPKGIQSAARAGAQLVRAGEMLNAAIGEFPTSGHHAVDGRDLRAFHTAAVNSDAAVARASRAVRSAMRELDGPAHAALPLVSGPARDVHSLVAATGRQLDGAQNALAVLGELTAPNTELRLLLISQDSAELRPTGGIVGSFGTLRFSHGTVTLEQYSDSLSLHTPTPPLTTPPDLARSLSATWDLINANWWPDFPTSAATVRDMFVRQGGGNVDGVIAITDAGMAQLLGALGPVKVPGYEQPVSGTGFQTRVLAEVELKNPPDVPKKKFLVLLATEIFNRLLSLPAAKVPRVADSMGPIIGGGDLQMWFAEPDRQARVARTIAAGALPKDDGRDFLMLADANMTASKSNLNLRRTATYRVRRDTRGRLIASLQLEYRNEGARSVLNPYYNGYLRIYTPAGTRLLDQRGRPQDEGTAHDGPYHVFARDVFVRPGEAVRVGFRYQLPNRVKATGYQLRWLRQAGTPHDTLRAFVGNSSYVADPKARMLVVRHSLAPNRIRALLHRRWLFRQLGA